MSVHRCMLWFCIYILTVFIILCRYISVLSIHVDTSLFYVAWYIFILFRYIFISCACLIILFPYFIILCAHNIISCPYFISSCPLHIIFCHLFFSSSAYSPLTLVTAHIRALISGVEAEYHPGKSIHYITKIAHHIIKLPLRNTVCTICNNVTTE